MKIFKNQNWVILAPIPALLIGAIVMGSNDISPLVYGQNIICYLIFGLLLLFLSAKPIHSVSSNRVSIIVVIILCCALVALTFLDRGLENVHRWLTIGSFRIYISSIVLPCVIMGIGVLLKNKSVVFSTFISVLIFMLLFFQPDASQLSAFAVSITLLVWVQVKQKPLKYGMAILSIGLIFYSWLHLDTLEAVPHVEGIILLAQDMGIVWFLLAIASLVLLLVPFLNFSNVSIYARAIALYYLVILISTIFGNFPVPIMGFGISPIIGYMLALLFLLRNASV